MSLSVANAVKTVALSHPEMDVAIIGNFGVTSSEGSPPFTTSGVWYDFFGKDSVIVSNPDTVFSLAAGAFHLFTNRRVESPDDDLITVSAEPATTPVSYRVEVATYPNPFRDTVGITYSITESGPVTLAIFDPLGRQVKRIDRVELTAGWHEEVFDLSMLASGTYFLRLTTPSGFKTQSLTKISQ